MEKKYKGVLAVICTPFGVDGQVDEAALRTHLRWLMDEGGVHAIIPCGSTGEFAFMTPDERKRVVAITLDEVAHQVPVIAGSAACATQEVIDTARTYQKMGVDGVMVAPSYYGSLKDEELYTHYALLAKNVDLPIMIYNNPATTKSDIMPEVVARLAEFDNIVAIKEAAAQVQRATEIMRLCGDKIEVICVCDNVTLEMFAVGVEGWVAGAANIVPKQCVALYDLMVVKKDLAKAKDLYFTLLPLFDMFEDEGLFIKCGKAGARMLGRPIGDPRKPVMPLPQDDEKRLKDMLERINAYEI
jgi:4-hydroxy-tetrahydrodipicolinate synthase